MRVAASTFALILLFQSSAFAGDGKGRHPWLRRLTLAASCAASFWDVQTTVAATRNGGLEANPLFSGPDGRPRWGRMIGIKAGTCAASWIAEERLAGRGPSDRFWIGMNTISAGAFTGLALRNRALAQEWSSPPAK